MDFVKYLTDNINLIFSNPVPFIAAAVITFGLTWRYAKNHYSERIESLKEKISLRDDQINYYKTLSETRPSPTTPSTTDISATANNLRDDILREIQFLKQHAGKALSVKLFERLQPKYEFLVILSEMFLMNKNNELAWDEAPKAPDALSEIRIIQERTT
jgi:nitrate reductase gamma subunit